MAGEVTRWRPTPAQFAKRTLGFWMATVLLALNLVDRADDPTPWGDRTLQLLLVFTFLVAFATIVVPAALTGVRLLPDGVEIRGWRRRMLRYEEIVDARVDRAFDDRCITLALRDGGSVTLPTPMRGRPKPTAATLDAAVASIRRRSDLGPAPSRLP